MSKTSFPGMSADINRAIVENLPEIVSQYPDIYGGDLIEVSCAVHGYISQQIPYKSRHNDKRSRKFFGPKECYQRGGNCEEKSILLASFIADIERLDVRTLLLAPNDSSSSGHQTIEIRFPFSSQYLYEEVRDFYKQYSELDPPERFFWDEDGQFTWVPADPTADCMGDISNSDEFIHDDGTDWDYHEIVEVREF